MSPSRLRVHVAWALVTLVCAAGWGRWVVEREEPLLREREWALAAAGRVRAQAAWTPPPGSWETPSLSTASPGAVGERQTELSDEDVVKSEIRRLLHSQKGNDCWEASKMISRILVPRVQVEMYYEQLLHPQDMMRSSALNAIMKLEGAAARTSAEKLLLTDPSEEVRETAASALGELESPQSTEALLQAFRDPVPTVRVAAAAALLRLGQTGPVSELLPLLSKDLDSPDGAVRRTAAEFLGNLNSPQAIPPLLRAIRDSSGNVRSSAMDSLGGMSVPEIVPALKALLNDPDRDIAETARRSLDQYQLQHPQ
jgi:HEAT repeat protein